MEEDQCVSMLGENEKLTPAIGQLAKLRTLQAMHLIVLKSQIVLAEVDLEIVHSLFKSGRKFKGKEAA